MKRRKNPKQKEKPNRQFVPLFHPSPDRGLTSQQAKILTDAGWDNCMVDMSLKSERQIIKEHVLTYFNLIFTILAGCLLMVGDFKDMTFLIIVVVNTTIGIVQQIRSKRAIEELTLLSAAKIRTVRDGRIAELHPDMLVREDIVELTSGSQIPADGTVLTGCIQVNEALITGESDAIPKGAGGSLLSGSFVISGKCRARLDAVGADSYAAKITLNAKCNPKTGKSEMVRALNSLIKFIGIVLIPIGAALFYTQFVTQHLGIRQAIISTVAALIGMIPEGLYLLTSIALAVSVLRLAKNRILIHEMNAIETLARVDVLCVDKTGTITAPQMAVRSLILLNESEWDKQTVEDTIGAFYGALTPDNDTSRAIADHFQNRVSWPVNSAVPFSSACKWSAVNFSSKGSFVIGAPEYVLGNDIDPLLNQIRFFTEKGCRVLLLAQCDSAREGELLGPVLPMALLVLENPVRPNAPKVFGFFRDQGVSVKVISGDDPVTVSAVAAQAGIDDANNYIDARELTTDIEIARAASHYSVFGRVVPDQKQKIVRALQSQGHTVAMTGDGVNDVLALKDADCGIAMASGADAASQVAQLVLLDSNFDAMPKVVLEGRRVINNIQRAAALYLVKNLLSFFLAIIALGVDFPYPFIPIQMTLISGLTIGIPSFFLALESNNELVRGKFLYNVFRKALPGALSAVFVIIFAELFAYTLAIPLGELSSICVILMAINGLTVIYYVSQPLNWRRRVLIITMGLGVILAVILFGEIFAMSTLSFISWLVLIVLSLLVIPVQATLEYFFAKCAGTLFKWRETQCKRHNIRHTFQKSNKSQFDSKSKS